MAGIGQPLSQEQWNSLCCYKLKATYHIYIFKDEFVNWEFCKRKWVNFSPNEVPHPNPMNSTTSLLIIILETSGSATMSPIIEGDCGKSVKKKKNTWPKAFSIYYIGKFNLIYWKNILLAWVIMIWIQKANISTQPTSPGLNENSSNIWSCIKRAQRAPVIYIWVKVTLCLSEVHFFKGQDGERKLEAENFTKAAPDPTLGWPTYGEAAVTGRTPGSDGVSKPPHRQKDSLQWSQRGAWSRLLEASRQRPGP